MDKWDYIDWNKTKTKYCYNNKNLKPKDPVIVNCHNCNKDLETKISSIRNRKNKQYKPTCRSCKQKKTWAENKDFRNKQSEIQSQKMKEVWLDDKYRENQSVKQSAIALKNWSDDNYKNKVSDGLKNRYAKDPEYRRKTKETLLKHDDKRREALDKRRSCEEYRSKLSQASKNNWEDSEYRERMIKIKNSKEYIENQRDKASENWKNPNIDQS